ncbi:MAG: CPBP family intramembrane metalloprotease [Leptolyngbya sp. PLA3]|nr:MAG: CPBP family intramembrane metalloprotease [Cyanobacteria bacterium CYA]MCE7967538.1 CPBP family intramembrane metalloprotease [Leptolyngbya sp. PL-A3]
MNGPTATLDETKPGARARRFVRAAEMVILFWLIPIGFTLWRRRPDAVTDLLDRVTGLSVPLLRHPNGLLLPTLAAFTIVCLVWLLLDRRFARRELWNWRGARAQLRPISMIALPMLEVLVLLSWQLSPGSWLHDTLDASDATRWMVWPGSRLFSLPRERPELWLKIMLFYPVVSVWPQEVLYRAFFFHRYACVLRRPWARVLGSALAFGFMHVLFLNAVAPLLTFTGGVLFAWTYERSRSTLACSIEHAIYGCWVFTVGLGAYFYGGTIYVDR